MVADCEGLISVFDFDEAIRLTQMKFKQRMDTDSLLRNHHKHSRR
jgi:hypothetical protein